MLRPLRSQRFLQPSACSSVSSVSHAWHAKHGSIVDFVTDLRMDSSGRTVHSRRPPSPHFDARNTSKSLRIKQSYPQLLRFTLPSHISVLLIIHKPVFIIYVVLPTSASFRRGPIPARSSTMNVSPRGWTCFETGIRIVDFTS